MSSDSFELLLNQLVKDLKVINENLELIGIFYLGKAAVKSLLYLSNSFRVFVLPKLVSNETWIRSHGKWAIVNGMLVILDDLYVPLYLFFPRKKVVPLQVDLDFQSSLPGGNLI